MTGYYRFKPGRNLQEAKQSFELKRQIPGPDPDSYRQKMENHPATRAVLKGDQYR